MFFIIILFAIIAAALIITLLLQINLIIAARDKNWSLSVKTLGFTVLQRRYEVRRKYGELLTLFSVDKNEKRIISLIDIIKSVNSPDEKSDEKGRNKLFEYINAKSKYKLMIEATIGLDDAFWTAVCCGIINSAVGTLVVINNKDQRHHIVIKTVPEFQKWRFSFNADCIITLSLANIIIGYMIYKKNKRR